MKCNRRLFVLVALLLLFSAAHAGVRTGTIVAAPVTVGDSTNTFPTAYEDEINGGYKIVSDEATMNSIPLSRRVPGMLCYVTYEATTFRLNSSNAWVVASSGGWIKGNGMVTLETPTNNVGIGMTPGVTLDVTSTNGNAARFTAHGAGPGWAGVIINQDNGGFGLYDQAPKSYMAGRVGIGTSVPTSTLEVNGDIRLAAMGKPSASLGKIYIDSTSHRLNYHDGTQWIEVDPAYSTNEVKSNYLNFRQANPFSGDRKLAFTPANDIIITSTTISVYNASSPGVSLEATMDVSGTRKAYIRYVAPSSNYSNWEQTYPIPIRVKAGQSVYYTVSAVPPSYYSYNDYIMDVITHYMDLPLL
ncbi:MAG TPA: hypothetical protein VMD02_05655 [Candidatus Omnitrophota bacterium]|nr:hypothetical protein [Candidatus Omnitrophota bacterium]